MQDMILTVLPDFAYIMPELVVSIGILVVLVIDVILNDKNARYTAHATIAVLAVAFFVIGYQGIESKILFFNLLAIDPFSIFFKYIFIVAATITVIMTMNSGELEKNGRRPGEFHLLLLGLTLGMMFLSAASSLLMIYISIELVSLSSFVLVSYLKNDKASNEGGLKYIIYGAFSSGVMIYGMSLIYGLTGQLNIQSLEVAYNLILKGDVLASVALLMMIAGFGYKISAAPFHFWAPDAYEGAPTPVTAFLSVGPKAAGFAVLIRFTQELLPGYKDVGMQTEMNWIMVIGVMAILTMTIGNVSALWQNNIKRLMAYSSIAHAGYLLMGVMLMSAEGNAAIMFYLVYYLLMNMGAFYIIMLFGNQLNSFELDDYRGLGVRAPILAIPMIIFLASLIGIPGTVGFAGKFILFIAVLQKGDLFFWVAMIAVINTVISAYYYFKIARMMFLKSPVEGHETKLEFPLLAVAIIFILAIPTIILGLYWNPLYEWALNSAVFAAL